MSHNLLLFFAPTWPRTRTTILLCSHGMLMSLPGIAIFLKLSLISTREIISCSKIVKCYEYFLLCCCEMMLFHILTLRIFLFYDTEMMAVGDFSQDELKGSL